MTHQSLRDLERELDTLRDERADDPDGFYQFIIGGDVERARERGGYYEWDAAREEYRNESGHTLPADAAPENESEITTMSNG